MQLCFLIPRLMLKHHLAQGCPSPSPRALAANSNNFQLCLHVLINPLQFNKLQASFQLLFQAQEGFLGSKTYHSWSWQNDLSDTFHPCGADDVTEPSAWWKSLPVRLPSLLRGPAISKTFFHKKPVLFWGTWSCSTIMFGSIVQTWEDLFPGPPEPTCHCLVRCNSLHSLLV